MLYIVDGTGPTNDSEYSEAMKTSHCKHLALVFRSFSHYLRGPAVSGGTNLGKNTMRAIKAASFVNPTFGLIAEDVLGLRDSTTNQKLKVLELIRNERKGGKIYLCGYSRGGATVVSVANELNQQGREVEAIFLFDPVDSDASLDNTSYIPQNVKQAFMAYRNMNHVHALEANAKKQAGEAGSAGGKAVKNVLSANVLPGIPSFLPIPPVGVIKAAQSVAEFGKQSAEAVDAQWQSFRWSNLVARDLMFNLCVKGVQSGAKLKTPWMPKAFDGTHGAMGGCIWPKEDYPKNTRFFDIDKQCAEDTRSWLFSCIHQTSLYADTQS